MFFENKIEISGDFGTIQNFAQLSKSDALSCKFLFIYLINPKLQLNC
ncbi:MAG: hypothetical protein BWX63_01923 [Bacteroidetes bacterium ADurb.Bin041]|jgi:hypothetical protein|nr:MAG: hypothetical protein BWX63_01923 [Bacteroidetes bacterium ADurb.Bin041]